MKVLDGESKDSSIFISAGDVSGNNHAKGLINEFGRIRPEIKWYGLGGAPMEDAGCRLLVEPDKETVMGFTRVLLRIPHYFVLLAKVAKFLKTNRPKVVVLVDYPGLNMRIARIAKSLKIPVVYFICPQFWAWATWRVKKFSRLVDIGLVIFPFEEAYFKSHGVKTYYIGHPSCDTVNEESPSIPIPEGEILGLLPGSRRQEMEMNLPVMLNSVKAILEKRPQMTPVLSHYKPDLLKKAKQISATLNVKLETVQGGMKNLMKSARFLIVGSGTATLEAAFSGTPFIVVYKVSKTAKKLAPHILTVPWICQVNLMAGEEIVPEMLLHNDNPAPVITRAMPFVEDSPLREKMLNKLEAFRAKFFKPGAIERASKKILDEFDL